MLALVIGIGTADAQSYGKKKKKKKKKKPAKTEQTDDYFDESGGFAHRLWYGGMLNFQIGNQIGGGNTLLLGISPMVGYKFTDNISAGPRLTLNYFVGYQPGENVKVLQTGIGGFGRVKFSPAIFAHIEYEILSLKEISDFGIQGGSENNFYGGLGYNSAMGSAFGYEIMILYNFLEDPAIRDVQVPIEFRAGFTYNF